MINHDRWIKSLTIKNNKIDNEANQLDHDRWINTIPQKNPVKKEYYLSPSKKYSLTGFLFVFGLLFVILIKNETRNIQKEINKLEVSISKIDYNLHQAILDNEVITSPANITRLANKYLDINLTSYKKEQIKDLNNNTEIINVAKTERIIYKNKVDKLRVNLKEQVFKKVEKKKIELEQIQSLYQEPKKIPKKIKKTFAKKIAKKKEDIRNLYKSPKEILTLEKVGKWTAVQVVKLFLGFPIVPGR